MEEMTGRRALLVDDERDMLTLLAKVLTKKCGCAVTTATSAEEALALVRADPPEVVLTDIKMPGMDGLELLRQLGSVTPAVTTILMTGHGTIDMAVQALKDGAYDFIEKPFDNERIIGTVLRAIERTRLLRENLQLHHRLGEEGDLLGFVGRSRRLLETVDLLRRVAPSNVTVLIRGESGTGKELAARALHTLSGRAERPMITVNCPALPEQILESELFGYRRGAFTGADRDKTGLFVEADGSTILLDEIADIPVSVQTKLLRVLQEKEVQPLGQNRTYAVDVRVVASTNQDLEAKIRRGEFREDLFYRLNVMTVTMPSLAQMVSDVPLLAQHFLEKYAGSTAATTWSFPTRPCSACCGANGRATCANWRIPSTGPCCSARGQSSNRPTWAARSRRNGVPSSRGTRPSGCACPTRRRRTRCSSSSTAPTWARRSPRRAATSPWRPAPVAWSAKPCSDC